MVRQSDEVIKIPPPSAIEELKAWLAAQGFDLIEQQDDMFFGDRRFRWRRDDISIQVSLDRGRWFVDLIPSWFDEWLGYGLEIVVDTLAESDHFTHLLTLPDAITILKGALPQIVKLLSTPEGCAWVEAKGRERAHRWFGA
jgi:hypothetical protein